MGRLVVVVAVKTNAEAFLMLFSCPFCPAWCTSEDYAEPSASWQGLVFVSPALVLPESVRKNGTNAAMLPSLVAKRPKDHG